MTESLARNASLTKPGTMRQLQCTPATSGASVAATHLAFDSFWFSSVALCEAGVAAARSARQATRTRCTTASAAHLDRGLKLDLQSLELLNRRVNIFFLRALVLRTRRSSNKGSRLRIQPQSRRGLSASRFGAPSEPSQLRPGSSPRLAARLRVAEATSERRGRQLRMHARHVATRWRCTERRL